MSNEKQFNALDSDATPSRRPPRLSAAQYVAAEAEDAQCAMQTAMRDLVAAWPSSAAWWRLAKAHPRTAGMVAGGVGVGLAGGVWYMLRRPARECVRAQVDGRARRGAVRRLAERGLRDVGGLLASLVVARLAGQSAAEETVHDVAAADWPVDEG